MSEAALAFDHVACLRGGRLLFEGIGFALGPGEAALAIGPNGAGKSSLLRIAAGLLDPAAGTVTRTGAVALSDEQLALDPRLPLADALGFWARIDRRTPDDVMTALDVMGIAHLAPVPVRMLSTGQRRRASLARVIAAGAPIWLLDEPGNGMDADALDRLGMVIGVHRRSGGIVLAATHQPLILERPLTITLGAR